MPRLHFVKKARKSRTVGGLEVKKGDAYYWWAFRIGRSSSMHASTTRPRRSQLTQSEFLSQMYEFEDNFSACLSDSTDLSADDMRSTADEIRALGQEQEEKADNMESAWPNGNPTIELLRERAEACESIASEIEQACDSLASSDEDQADFIVSLKKELESVTWSYN